MGQEATSTALDGQRPPRSARARYRYSHHRGASPREADLLPVAYFQVVFTLPAAIADIACQNKAAITTCC